MKARSKAVARKIRRRFVEVLEQRGAKMSDPNDWLTEAEIAAIIGRHMTAGSEKGK